MLSYFAAGFRFFVTFIIFINTSPHLTMTFELDNAVMRAAKQCFFLISLKYYSVLQHLFVRMRNWKNKISASSEDEHQRKITSP